MQCLLFKQTSDATGIVHLWFNYSKLASTIIQYGYKEGVIFTCDLSDLQENENNPLKKSIIIFACLGSIKCLRQAIPMVVEVGESCKQNMIKSP